MSVIKEGDTVLSLKQLANGHRRFAKGEEFTVRAVYRSNIDLEAVSDGTPLLCIVENFKLKEEVMNGNEIKRGNFIIGSINKQTGELSFAKQPKIHTYQGAAIAEAKRLATECPQKKFVVVEVKAVARTTDVVVE